MILRGSLRVLRAHLRFAFLSGLDWLLCCLVRPRRPAAGVCVIRLDAIGDFVLWQDAAQHCRQMFPAQKITLLGNAAWADLAAVLPHWDEVWPVDMRRITRSLAYRWHVLGKLRRAGFSLVFAPVQSRSYFGDEAMLRACGAPIRIGANGDTANMPLWQKRLADRRYTRQISLADDVEHELLRNGTLPQVLLQERGLQYSSGMPRLPLVARLNTDFGLTRGCYFIVFPGASWSGRQWPAAKFVELTRALHTQTGLSVVLCGSEAESELCATIAAQCDALNLAGRTRLTEFVEIVRNAALVVGNETSVIHIAAACGIPSVCILGGGHFGRFAPYPEAIVGQRPVVVNRPMPCYHCNWKCNQAYERNQAVPCVRDIAVSEVVAAVLALRQSAVPAATAFQS